MYLFKKTLNFTVPSSQEQAHHSVSSEQVICVRKKTSPTQAGWTKLIIPLHLVSWQHWRTFLELKTLSLRAESFLDVAKEANFEAKS